MDELRWFLGGLWNLFVSYLELWARATDAVVREFGLDLSPPIIDLIGFVLGGLVLWGSANAIFKWNRRGNQTQAFPLRTAETPNQIVAADRRNLAGLLLKVVVALILLAILISSRA